MSHIFGAFTLDGQSIDPEICAAVDAEASRFPTARRKNFRSSSIVVEHIDFEHVKSPGVIETDRAATFVAGDPLSAGRAAQNRQSSVEFVHDALSEAESVRLKECYGVFCGVQVCLNGEPSITLFTDNLSIRPLYFYRRGSVCAFSTRFGMFGRFPPRLIEPSEAGILETLSLATATGTRTTFEEVSALPAASIVKCDSNGIEFSLYRDWGSVPLREMTRDELSHAIDRTFTEAISDRIGSAEQQWESAFLSGGMDSRAIVGKLRACGRRVVTVNYAPSGSLDRELGALAADALQTRHVIFTPVSGSSIGERRDAAAGVSIDSAAKEELVRDRVRDRVVWAGDGGSVCLGHVYIDQAIIDSARTGDFAAAARGFLAKNATAFPEAPIRQEYRASLRMSSFLAVEQQLKSFSHADPGKNIFLFLLLNDQRRHMYGFFEDLSPSGFEQLMPFFDPRLIELVLSAPLDHLIEHRVYHDWFTNTDVWDICSVPWQTYPGHVPCPLPLPTGLRYQWSRSGIYSTRESRQLARRAALQALKQLFSARSKQRVFRYPYVLASIALCLLGLHQYAYIPEAVNRLAQA